MIGSALAHVDQQFSGDNSPFRRWGEEVALAHDELLALALPMAEWPPIIGAFC